MKRFALMIAAGGIVAFAGSAMAEQPPTNPTGKDPGCTGEAINAEIDAAGGGQAWGAEVSSEAGGPDAGATPPGPLEGTRGRGAKDFHAEGGDCPTGNTGQPE